MAIVAGRPTAFLALANRQKSKPVVVRAVTANPIVADSATRTVAVLGATGFIATECDTLWVGIEVTSGAGTVTLEPLILDADGALWMQILMGAMPGITDIAAPAAFKTPAMSPGQLIEVPVLGQTVFFRIDAVGGSPVNLQVLAYPGRPRLGLRI